MTVTERISAEDRAVMKVNAIGRNILPSIPCKLRIGINTITTMSPANKIGLPTSLAEDSKTWSGTFLPGLDFKWLAA